MKRLPESQRQAYSSLRADLRPHCTGTSTWPLAAFLTKLPGEFVITPATPGQPEQGRLRGICIKCNEEFGQLSPEYPVTVS